MPDIRRRIIALGGGGFSEPENLALDRYILAQACVGASSRLRATASGESDNYIVRFYSAYLGLPCRPRIWRSSENSRPEILSAHSGRHIRWRGKHQEHVSGVA